jgi:hypothetical protein
LAAERREAPTAKSVVLGITQAGRREGAPLAGARNPKAFSSRRKGAGWDFRSKNLWEFLESKVHPLHSTAHSQSCSKL